MSTSEVPDTTITSVQQSTPLSETVDSGLSPSDDECQPWIGVVVPTAAIPVTAPAAGKLSHFFVEVGDHVVDAEPLFRMENRKLQFDLKVARASMDRADAEVEAASMAEAQAERNYIRRSQNPKVFSIEEVENALISLNTAMARSKAALARKQMQEIELERREGEISGFEVLAQSGGLVFRQFHEAGEFVQEGAPVIEVSSPQSHLIRFALPIPARSQLPAEAALDISLDGPSLEQGMASLEGNLQATLLRIHPHYDPSLGIMLAEASIESGPGLQPGQGVLIQPPACIDAGPVLEATASLSPDESDHLPLTPAKR